MESFTLTKENLSDCVDAAIGRPISSEGNVVLPESVIYNGKKYMLTSIGDSAFSDCTDLTDIIIPEGVENIGSWSFSGCSNLTSIIIPGSVKYIGDHAFCDCNSLTTITIPNNVKNINDLLFYNCKSLSSIVIPDSVESIGIWAFYGCSYLTSVTLPDSVKNIGERAFYDCNNLTTIAIPKSVENIDNFVFYNCNSLTSVNIPDGVKSIGYNAFHNCNNLTSITIPNSVEDIAVFAFSGCHSLMSITIPNVVEYIGDAFVQDCPDTLTIKYMGTYVTNKMLNLVKEQSDGLSDHKCLSIAKYVLDLLENDIYSPGLIFRLCNAEHGGRLESTVAQIQKDFQVIGFYDIKNKVDEKAKGRLTALFQADNKSHGVVPKIIDALTITATEFHISPEEIVKSFEKKKFRDAVIAMRSRSKGNRFCDMEAVLFAMNFDVNTVKNVILENQNKDYASALLCESYKKNDEHLLNLAKWVASHPDVSQDLAKDIVKYKNSITIGISDNVNAIRSQISKNEALLEIQEIEKAYPDFKFANCKCNLPKTEVELGDYKAYIMDEKDTRQAIIGYDTDCCQHLNGEGETAMMYGLANPDAGFFVIEDKTSGKILAQAETWQMVDKQILVFDNIEFANDRQIEQFAPVLAKWCKKSTYPDILMGNGYNEMINDSIRVTAGIVPPMTDKLQELFFGRKDIESEEFGWESEEWEMDDSPYTDADESCSILKSNNTVEPYFKRALDNYMLSHSEMPCTDNLFSEPSKEDYEVFRHEEEQVDAYEMVSGNGMEDHKEQKKLAIEDVDIPEIAENIENDEYDESDDFENI